MYEIIAIINAGIINIKITALHRQIKKDAKKHSDQIEKTKRDISYDAEKKIKVFEYENQQLHAQVSKFCHVIASCWLYRRLKVKQLESEVEAANQRAEKAEREKKSLEVAVNAASESLT